MLGKKAGLGSEHPKCDTVQLALLLLFFLVWTTDALSYFIFNLSTIFLVQISHYHLLAIPSILSFGIGIYLALKSHEAIFGENGLHPNLVNSGVYSWVRHPMYLGILMFCLGFLFIMFSILSSGIWIAFFIFYDKMATYEETDLVRKLGDQYVKYQSRVGKWFPKL
jgi:protein-S-isoprenylcysteine O-methyltransferase Ste14